MSVNTVESPEKNEVIIKVSGRFDFSCHQEFIKGYKAYPPGSKCYVVDLSGGVYGQFRYGHAAAIARIRR